MLCCGGVLFGLPQGGLQSTTMARLTSMTILGSLLLLSLLAPSVSAFYFYTPVGGSSCFAQESGPEEETVTVHYSTKQNEGVLKAVVTSPTSKTVMDIAIVDLGKESSFSFQTTEAGRFDICFHYSAASSPLVMSVDIIDNVDKDYRDPKTPITEYSEGIDKVRAVVGQAESEMGYLHDRQVRFDQTVESTHFRVITLAITQILVVIVVVTWQVLHLRQFFLAKKLV